MEACLFVWGNTIPGLAAVHRTSLTGRRLFQRYIPLNTK
jgi:hypothetical protein